MFCQKIKEKETTNYCNDCKKIICSDCKGNHFHKNISKNEFPKINYMTRNNKNTYLSKESNEYNSVQLKKDNILESNQQNIITENINKREYLSSIFENIINDESGILDHQNNKYINIIYHDENINKSGNYSLIVSDAKYFESKINGSLLLTTNSTNFQLVLENIY